MPRKRGPDGRPTLLDTKRRDILLEAIRQKGVRVQVAARLAGIHPNTVEEWIRRGEGRDAARPSAPIYKQFAEDVARAKAEFEANMLAAIAAQAPRDYNAAKFWLQHNVPEVYGERPIDEKGTPTAGTVITGGNIIVIPAEQARRVGLQHIEQQRLASGDSTALDDLADLVVGPDD